MCTQGSTAYRIRDKQNTHTLCSLMYSFMLYVIYAIYVYTLFRFLFLFSPRTIHRSIQLNNLSIKPTKHNINQHTCMYKTAYVWTEKKQKRGWKKVYPEKMFKQEVRGAWTKRNVVYYISKQASKHTQHTYRPIYRE